MTNQIIVAPQQKPSALAVMASRCNVDPAKLHSTLKNTVFKGATDDELLALVVTANTYELNPILKELYAFPKKGGGITPMVGVDGWIKIANRQPNFDGMDVEVYGDGKTPTHATGTIYLKDRSHPVKVTEYFEECKRNTDPWNQMPRRMIRNKAIIQAIRLAFGVSGIHDEDEARDISGQVQIVAGAKPVFRPRAVEPVEIEDDIPMGEPVQEVQSVEELPKFEADTPQRQIQVAITDAGVSEADFLKALKATAPQLVGKSKLVSELSDDAANAALADLNEILTAIEEGAK
ncbi:MAG: recombinase [Proteobacteria bacterium]|nr:recombinase [Pseudomonadota bacterium]